MHNILTYIMYTDSDKNKLVVAVPIYDEPLSYVNDNGDIDGLNYHAWQEVNKVLTKRTGITYNMEYVVVKNPNNSELIDGLKSRKYDVVVGNFTSDPLQMSYVNYTYPFMSMKYVGVYSHEDTEALEYTLLKKTLSVLYYPFIVLFIIALFGTIFVGLTNKKSNILGTFTQMINGFLGDKRALLDGSYFVINPDKNILYWVIGIVILLLSFIFLFYLQAVAISKSLDIIQFDNDPFRNTQGKNVMVSKGNPNSEDLKRCCGIVPIETKSNISTIDGVAKEYMKKKNKNKLIGFYYSGIEANKLVNRDKNFRISSYPISSPSPVSFMVSKYNPELLYNLNESIASVNWNSLLNKKCKKFVNRLCFST